MNNLSKQLQKEGKVKGSYIHYNDIETFVIDFRPLYYDIKAIAKSVHEKFHSSEPIEGEELEALFIESELIINKIEKIYNYIENWENAIGITKGVLHDITPANISDMERI